MGFINNLLGKRKDPSVIVASIASGIDEAIRTGGVALLSKSMIVLDKNDSVIITDNPTWFATREGQAKGIVFINAIQEFKDCRKAFEHMFDVPNSPMSQQDTEHLGRMRYEMVSELAMAVFAHIEKFKR